MNQKILDFFKKINYGVEDDLDGKNYRYFHCLRVTKLAREIAEHDSATDSVNRQAMFLLALFHDIGKNEELLRENGLSIKEHDANNVILFEKYLYPLLIDQTLIPELRKIVEDFSYKKYELGESKIVRDADNLDEIGILNFWRMGVYAGKHHCDAQESVEHYFSFDRQSKIEKMEGLFFDYSRKVCAERMVEMDELVTRFKDVAVAELEDVEI